MSIRSWTQSPGCTFYEVGPRGGLRRESLCREINHARYLTAQVFCFSHKLITSWLSRLENIEYEKKKKKNATIPVLHIRERAASTWGETFKWRSACSPHRYVVAAVVSASHPRPEEMLWRTTPIVAACVGMTREILYGDWRTWLHETLTFFRNICGRLEFCLVNEEKKTRTIVQNGRISLTDVGQVVVLYRDAVYGV